jgi:hypothetical protein
MEELNPVGAGDGLHEKTTHHQRIAVSHSHLLSTVPPRTMGRSPSLLNYVCLQNEIDVQQYFVIIKHFILGLTL